MNILLHELKAYRKSTIIWTVSLVGVGCSLCRFIHSFTKDTEDLKSY